MTGSRKMKILSSTKYSTLSTSNVEFAGITIWPPPSIDTMMESSLVKNSESVKKHLVLARSLLIPHLNNLGHKLPRTQTRCNRHNHIEEIHHCFVWVDVPVPVPVNPNKACAITDRTSTC